VLNVVNIIGIVLSVECCYKYVSSAYSKKVM